MLRLHYLLIGRSSSGCTIYEGASVVLVCFFLAKVMKYVGGNTHLHLFGEAEGGSLHMVKVSSQHEHDL